MKRYFISIGSSGTWGLLRLIEKMREENIFNRYDDEYIAMDTDKTPSGAWGKLRTLESSLSRVHAETPDYTSVDNQDITAFQPQWTWDHIPTDGVGGNREKAEKARNWRDMLRDRVFTKLQHGDLIVLIGSAFGGTSTGLFWSIAEFIADETSKYVDAAPTPDERKTRAEVTSIGFVMFPAPKAGTKYSIGPNLCDFVRELQLAHWRRRLQQYTGNKAENAGRLIAPVYSLRAAHGRFPLYSARAGRAQQGVEHSFLPMTTLYCLPTPEVDNGIDGGHNMARTLLAEALFAVCYIGVQGGFQGVAVDRHSYVQGKLSEEDPSFGGLDMVVFKSGRARSLRQWFSKKVTNACDAFLQEAPKPNITANVVRCLNDFLTSFGEGAFGQQNNRTALDTSLSTALAGGKLAQFSEEMDDKWLRPLLVSIPGCPIVGKWSFANFMQFLISDGNRKWLPEINQQVLRDAYQSFSIEHKKKANAVSGTAGGLKKLTDQTRKVLARRLNSPQVKWLGNDDKVAQEVKDAFRERFNKGVDELVTQERIRKTPVADDTRFLNDLTSYVRRMSELRAEQATKTDSAGAFPYVVDGVIKDFDIPADWRWDGKDFSQVVLALALESNPSDRQDQAEIDFQSAVDTFNTLLTNPSHLDPLREAGLDIKVSDGHRMVSPFAKALKAGPADGKYSIHFIVSPSSGAIPLDCSLSFEQVKERFGLDGFDPAGRPIGAPFFDKGQFSHRLPNPESGQPRLINKGLTIAAENTQSYLQGLWLGTSRTNFTLRDILSKIYANNSELSREWMDESLRITRASGTPRRLMSLQETVWTAALLGALEARARECWSTKFSEDTVASHTITLTFHADGREKEFGEWDMSDTGFIAESKKPDTVPQIQLESISHAALSAILRWLRTGIETGNGFCTFYPREISKLKQLETIEAQILAQARLHIEDGEYEAIQSLQKAIHASLTVTIN